MSDKSLSYLFKKFFIMSYLVSWNLTSTFMDMKKVRSYTLSLISYKALDDFTVKEWKILSCLEKKLYKRLSGYRKNAKETVWDKAKDEQGVVKDFITKR